MSKGKRNKGVAGLILNDEGDHAFVVCGDADGFLISNVVEVLESGASAEEEHSLALTPSQAVALRELLNQWIEKVRA